MKKTLAILAVALMILGTVSPALAARPVCPVYGCTRTVNHAHDGKTYSPHHAEDGHYYHQCGLSGCEIAGGHNHNAYYEQSYSGGYQGGHHSNAGAGSGYGSCRGRGGRH